MLPRHVGSRYPTPGLWWLVTELNRVHWYFRPALCRRVHEPNFGGRCETRTRISRVQAVGNPLIRTAHYIKWGDRSESNRLNVCHRHAPHRLGSATSGAGRVNRTLVGEVQALCTATVLDQQPWSWHRESNAGFVLTCTGSPTELCQRLSER